MSRKPYPKPPKQTNSNQTNVATILKVVIFSAIAIASVRQGMLFLTAYFSKSAPSSVLSTVPSIMPSTATTFPKPECNIKGNISVSNPANRFYHLPGMEDYESTNIDTSKGERWFCTEAEAISNGWKKAPR